ncbi:C-type lectin LmsL-like [Oculina patagonica]
MKLLAVLLPVLVVNLAAGCDDGWKLFDGKCFKLFQERKSWPDAEKSCKKVKARLVKIESEKLNDFLLKTFMQIPFDEMNLSAWIGLTDKKKEGKFVWLDGSSPTYNNWAEEQPNNEDGGQECVELVNGVFWPGGLSQVGLWNDYQCNAKLMYLCEKKSK